MGNRDNLQIEGKTYVMRSSQPKTLASVAMAPAETHCSLSTWCTLSDMVRPETGCSKQHRVSLDATLTRALASGALVSSVCNLLK